MDRSATVFGPGDRCPNVVLRTAAGRHTSKRLCERPAWCTTTSAHDCGGWLDLLSDRREIHLLCETAEPAAQGGGPAWSAAPAGDALGRRAAHSGARDGAAEQRCRPSGERARHSGLLGEGVRRQLHEHNLVQLGWCDDGERMTVAVTAHAAVLNPWRLRAGRDGELLRYIRGTPHSLDEVGVWRDEDEPAARWIDVRSGSAGLAEALDLHLTAFAPWVSVRCRSAAWTVDMSRVLPAECPVAPELDDALRTVLVRLNRHVADERPSLRSARGLLAAAVELVELRHLAVDDVRNAARSVYEWLEPWLAELRAVAGACELVLTGQSAHPKLRLPATMPADDCPSWTPLLRCAGPEVRSLRRNVEACVRAVASAQRCLVDQPEPGSVVAVCAAAVPWLSAAERSARELAARVDEVIRSTESDTDAVARQLRAAVCAVVA
ncbi:hypothetical protein [Lentzea sp. E54]|uniref:hypothetical protein n=1 Tax=Lentzea xerophila TaxID=3435883 RepID=UPI003DA29CAF